MPTYLRLEGVNLGNFVFDTADLSTIRGGGLLLLESVKALEKFLREECHVRVETIIHGASTGLFKVDTPTGGAAALVNRANTWLTQGAYRHATFVVDYLETLDGMEFSQVNTKLTNANRIRQMKAPSLIYPELKDVSPTTPVCDLDFVRPGPQSQSAKTRQDHGRKRKKDIYAGILKDDGEVPDNEIPRLTYAKELNELAGNSASWGNLKDKMAVIAVDGNSIGEKTRALDRNAMAAFSKGLRKQQASFLHTLLKFMAGDQHSKNGDSIRLETLVWGGDEVIWVVPAWKGIQLLQAFYKDLQRPEWASLIPGVEITFSAGIVFCNHKSPIHSIRDLAAKLCSRVKIEKKENKDTNIIAYQVLDSFDNVADVDVDKSSIKDHELEALLNAIPDLRTSVPRRKLHELIRAIERNDKEAAKQTIENAALKGLDPAIGQDIRGNWHRWRNISDLWDYLNPEQGGL